MSKGSEAIPLRTLHDPVFPWQSGKEALIKITMQIRGQVSQLLVGTENNEATTYSCECDLCLWSSESRKGLWEDALQGGGSSNARGVK